MTLLMSLLVAWLLLSALGILGATAVCRSGHLEDVARGFDADPAPFPADLRQTAVPAPRSERTAQPQR
jgi:hypothetical protein